MAGSGEGGAPPPDLTLQDEEMERLLREVAGTIRHRGRRTLGELGVTAPQFDALHQLKRHGEMTMGELCEKLQLASSTVTDLVARMERAGLVRRRRDAEDRRVVHLRSTERGARVIEDVMRTRVHYVGCVLSHLSPEQRVQVADAVRLLHAQVTAPWAP